MKLRLAELQKLDKETQKFKAIEKLQERWKNIDGVLYYQELLFIPKVIQTKLINCHYDKLLAGHFGINKT